MTATPNVQQYDSPGNSEFTVSVPSKAPGMITFAGDPGLSCIYAVVAPGSSAMFRAAQGFFFTWTPIGEVYWTVSLPGCCSPICPFEFGAIGDGVADDTAAIQRSIDAAYSSYLCIPGGYTFAVSNLSVTQQIHIQGDGAGEVGLDGTVENVGSCIKQLPGSTGDLLTIFGAPYSTISGVAFDGNGANQAEANNCVHIINSAFMRLDGVIAHHALGSGFVLDNSNNSNDADEINLIGCFGFSNTLHGLLFVASNGSVAAPGDCLIEGCRFDYNLSDGISGTFAGQNVFQGCNVLTNTGNGISMTFSYGGIIGNCEIRNNGQAGIMLGPSPGNGCDHWAISACHVHLNSQNETDAYPGILIQYSDDIRLSNIYSGSGYFGSEEIKQSYGVAVVDSTNILFVGNSFPASDNVSGSTSIDEASTYQSAANQGLPNH